MSSEGFAFWKKCPCLWPRRGRRRRYMEDNSFLAVMRSLDMRVTQEELKIVKRKCRKCHKLLSVSPNAPYFTQWTSSPACWSISQFCCRPEVSMCCEEEYIHSFTVQQSNNQTLIKWHSTLFQLQCRQHHMVNYTCACPSGALHTGPCIDILTIINEVFSPFFTSFILNRIVEQSNKYAAECMESICI